MLVPVPEGAFAVRLGEDASIKTRVTNVTNGTFYSKLNVSVSPNAEPNDRGMLHMQSMYSSDGWDSYSWGFLAQANEIEIMLHNPAIEKDPACGPLIDFIALKLKLQILMQKMKAGNMLKNGNFEEGPYILPNTNWGVLIPPNIEDDHSTLPGWIIESLRQESAIAQIVMTKKGKVYDLMFLVEDASNSCQGSTLIEAFAGKITLRVPYESTGNGGFKRAKLQFTRVSECTGVRFLNTYYHIKSDHSSSLCGPVVDDVRLIRVRHPQLS
ncbi:unnamed protein product [Withania somnifera]